MNILEVIGRKDMLFADDIAAHEAELSERIANSRFLVIGAAGTIGQATTREIFKRSPKVLHCVDISENNLVELVRDIRSTLGYFEGDFATFAVDCGRQEFSALLAAEGPYDYVLNLSALKHVRSEKDPFTLMRLIEVNVLNTITTVAQAKAMGAQKYFCVSTDKAASPVSMMGASKRIMELFLMRDSLEIQISTARFANVAFSDGSLLHGFNQRFAKQQPISAPNDVQRYFIVPQESGELCLSSCILGDNRDIFFPKMSEALQLTKFSDIAERYLQALGFEPYQCASEDEARGRTRELISQHKWPVYFFTSDTSGEKDFEVFFTDRETLDLSRFANIGIIKNTAAYNSSLLDRFLERIAEIRARPTWEKAPIVDLFTDMVPDFNHKETGRYLDGRM